MEDGEKLSLEQIRAFLEGSGELRFQAWNRQEIYGWANAKMTGLSRAQSARLIKVYQQGGEVEARIYRRHRFRQQYLASDMELLAEVDTAHETWSGPATQRILYRAFTTMPTSAANGWLACRWPSCTGYGEAGRAATGESTIRSLDPRKSPSANGAGRSRKAVRDTCESTPYAKAIGTV